MGSEMCIRDREKYDRQNDENKGFRKKALERAEEREQEARERYEEQQNKESRFSALAKKRAAMREAKRQERLARRNRK